LFKGWIKLSFIDYPDKLSTVLFTEKCNFRCPYCHNFDLVLPNSLKEIELDEIFLFLEKRIRKLDGVVISGGEPLLHSKELEPFIERVKEMGFLIKIDTNGSFPEKVVDWDKKNLVNLWAVDFKVPFEKYDLVSGDGEKVRITIRYLLEKNTSSFYELRTTIFPRFHNIETLTNMLFEIEGANVWYWQNFRNDRTLDGSASLVEPYSKDILNDWKNRLNIFKKVGKILIR
jgi:pyruvate formate lyase activating enzyme